jgi:hypothetical protein
VTQSKQRTAARHHHGTSAPWHGSSIAASSTAAHQKWSSIKLTQRRSTVEKHRKEAVTRVMQ